MRFSAITLLALSFASLCVATVRRYDGDKVLTVVAAADSDWDLVTSILNKHIPVKDQDIWAEPRQRDRKAFILVQSQYLSHVTADFQNAGLQYEIKIQDVQRLIERSQNQQGYDIGGRRYPVPPVIDMKFPRYSEVLMWMEETSTTYPELASTFSIGETYEGRPMQILKLGLGGGNKWTVWIDAGLHAREWLAPTTAIYVAHQLIDGYAQGNPFITEYLRFFDFEIMAVANPDGYEYCHTTERLWRKNRKPTINPACTGIDLNRNFDFEWGGVNADADPCSNLYMGPSAESEIEVQNIVNYIMSNNHKYLYYHAYHTWGELYFTRWDYSSAPANRPEDHYELFDLAARAVNSINNVHNETYIAGVAPELMYAFAGSSSDWARGVAGIKYPFLTELRDFSGDYAFVAPPEEIEPCGEENWQGMQAVLVEIMGHWGGTSPPPQQ